MVYQRHASNCTTEFRSDQYGNWYYRFRDITNGNKLTNRISPKDGICPHCGVFAQFKAQDRPAQPTLF